MATVKAVATIEKSINAGRAFARKVGLDPYENLNKDEASKRIRKDAVAIHLSLKGRVSTQEFAEIVKSISLGPKCNTDLSRKSNLGDTLHYLMDFYKGKIKDEYSHIRPFTKTECNKFLYGLMEDPRRKQQMHQAIGLLSSIKYEPLLPTFLYAYREINKTYDCMFCGLTRTRPLSRLGPRICSAPKCQLTHITRAIRNGE